MDVEIFLLLRHYFPHTFSILVYNWVPVRKMGAKRDSRDHLVFLTYCLSVINQRSTFNLLVTYFVTTLLVPDIAQHHPKHYRMMYYGVTKQTKQIQTVLLDKESQFSVP